MSRQVNTISKSFLFQHIFYENPISLLRVGHKHMGDRSNDLPVLQDRRPGQSLDNTSGPVDQVLVCHTETDAFVGLGGIEIYLVDLDVVRGKFPSSSTKICAAPLLISCLYPTGTGCMSCSSSGRELKVP